MGVQGAKMQLLGTVLVAVDRRCQNPGTRGNYKPSNEALVYKYSRYLQYSDGVVVVVCLSGLSFNHGHHAPLLGPGSYCVCHLYR
jgi:hypothetical protein